MATVIWYSNPTSGNAMNWTDSNQWNQATDGSGTAGNPDSTDDKAVIQSGDTVTLDTNVTTGQCSNLGTLTGNLSYSLTLAGSDEDNNYSNTGTVTNLNLIMTGLRASGDRTVVDVGSGIHDFTLNDTTNSGNNVHVLGNNLSIAGDLTITSGTLNTQSFGTDRSLTVTGKTEIDDGGTLTCNASTVSLGSGQRENWYALLVKHNGVFAGGTGTHTVGSFAVYSGGTATLTSDVMTIDSEHSVDNLSYNNSASGTLNHGSGTVTLTYAGESRLESGNDSLNNLIINHSSADIDLYNEALTCAGDLTITAGELNTGSDVALTVTGDVSVTGTLTGNASAISMGSLTIASGGTYSATSGTTTLTTGNATYSAEGNFALVGGGTFTHNNGTLVFDSVGQRLPKGGTFYNVTLTGSQTTGGLYLYSSVLSPAGIMPDGTTGANYISILGTLTITDDELRPYNVDKIYVHNLIIGDGTGSANSAKFDMAEADGFDGTVFVDNVTIHSDGQLLFGDGDETSATVGSSALNIYGAFRNLGGNVTIE